jgi:hypothetical protein
MKLPLWVIPSIATIAGLGWLISEPGGGALDNIMLAGRSVSGRNLSEIRSIARRITSAGGNTPVVLVVDGRRVPVKRRALRIMADVDAAAARAWLVGREPNLFARLMSRLQLRRDTIDVAVPVTCTPDRSVWRQLDTPPEDAMIVPDREVGRVHPDRPGLRVRRDEALQAIASALSRGEDVVSLPVEPIDARITASELRNSSSLRVKVIVPITSRNPGAIANARRAAILLNGTAIMPGETLSVNQRLGKRSEESGWEKAPVLISGRRDVSLGGGICVVSTAAFQAACRAGLQIVERHAHSRVPRYAAPGQDATLDYGHLDLRIRNNTSAPVVLSVLAQTSRKRIVMRIFGREQPAPIKLTTTTSREPRRLTAETYTVTGATRRWLCSSRYLVGP